MILQALVDYYEALAAKGKVAKPGWGNAKISYALNIDKTGKVTKPSFFENFCAKRQENSRIATEHIAAGSN